MGFLKWAKKRITPPKSLRQGKILKGLGDMYKGVGKGVSNVPGVRGTPYGYAYGRMGGKSHDEAWGDTKEAYKSDAPIAAAIGGGMLLAPAIAGAGGAAGAAGAAGAGAGMTTAEMIRLGIQGAGAGYAGYQGHQAGERADDMMQAQLALAEEQAAMQREAYEEGRPLRQESSGHLLRMLQEGPRAAPDLSGLRDSANPFRKNFSVSLPPPPQATKPAVDPAPGPGTRPQEPIDRPQMPDAQPSFGDSVMNSQGRIAQGLLKRFRPRSDSHARV